MTGSGWAFAVVLLVGALAVAASVLDLVRALRDSRGVRVGRGDRCG